MRYASLDVLRTVAALIVAVGHFFFWKGEMNVFPATFFLAVDFFFLISGFTMMNSLYKKDHMTFEKYCKTLVVSRLTRLWLPYVLISIICVTLHCIINGKIKISTVFMILFCGQAWGFSFGESIISNTTIGIAWYLSVELYLSILWFPLIFKFRKYKWEIGLFLSFIVFICYNILVNDSNEFMGITYARLNLAGLSIPGGVIRGILGYSLGGLVFFARQVLEPLTKRIELPVIWSVSEIIVILLPIIYFGGSISDRQNEYLFPIFSWVLVLIVTMEKGICSKIMSNERFSSASSLFFGIYLVHPLIIQVFSFDSGGGIAVPLLYSSGSSHF